MVYIRAHWPHWGSLYHLQLLKNSLQDVEDTISGATPGARDPPIYKPGRKESSVNFRRRSKLKLEHQP